MMQRMLSYVISRCMMINAKMKCWTVIMNDEVQHQKLENRIGWQMMQDGKMQDACADARCRSEEVFYMNRIRRSE